MKILSFDIGMKNLAYSILEYDPEKKEFLDILYWENINIYENDQEVQIHNRKCTHCDKKKRVKCIRPSVSYFFEKMRDEWIDEPEDQFSCLFLNNSPLRCEGFVRREVCTIHKKKVEKGIEGMDDDICFYNYDNKNLKCVNKLYKKRENKEYICDKKAKFIKYDEVGRKLSFCVSCYKKQEDKDNFQEVIKKNISEDEIYMRIYNKFLSRKQFEEVDEVILENQPALKNPKMKSIQMFIYSFFFIRRQMGYFPNLNRVSFFSAYTKFDSIFKDEKPKELENYKDRKKQSIYLTKKLVSEKWNEHLLKHPKKDDLADAFIQGLTYISKHYDIKVEIEEEKETLEEDI